MPDIEEGLNAGMWTIGVAMTGNEVGLSEAEITKLPVAERARLPDIAYQRLEPEYSNMLLLRRSHFRCDKPDLPNPFASRRVTRDTRLVAPEMRSLQGQALRKASVLALMKSNFPSSAEFCGGGISSRRDA